MKVTIIDVIKEVKDFDKPRKILQKAEHRYRPTQILDENTDPNDIPDEQGTLKTYELEEICDNTNSNRLYYVQKDDNEIFNDLLLINSQNINDKIDEKVKIIREIILIEELSAQKENIKKLSKWRRLFNKF